MGTNELDRDVVIGTSSFLRDHSHGRYDGQMEFSKSLMHHLNSSGKDMTYIKNTGT